MSVEEELWPSVLESMNEKLKKINLPHQINNVKTFQGKIGKALENFTIRQQITKYISKCGEVHHYKSGSTASRLRDQGNDKFKQRDNGGALKLYSESIICAPEFGPELSLAYGNRSASLFHLGDYNAALKDVEMALSNKYPRNLEYKMLQRQAQCLVRIGRYTEAKEVLSSCEKAINVGKLSEEKKASVIRDVNAMNQEVESLLKRQLSQEKSPCEEASPVFNNPSLPQASPKLVLENSDEKIRGRFVTTKTAIEEGEVLFSETPYSSVLLPDQYSSHCHHCYRQLSAPVPCKKCTQPRYCSLQCVEEGWSYHQYECGHLDLLHSIGIGHLAVRTILVTGLDGLNRIKKKVQLDCYLPSVDDPYSQVYSLMHHVDKMQEEEVFQYTVTAALLATFLAKKTKFLFPNKSINQAIETDLDEEIVNYLGGLLLRHLCQLVGNAHAVTQLRESDNGDVQQVRLATAIYPSASMMNHSCVTTIINQFQGSRLIVRATRALQPGNEVTNCYGPHYRRHAYAQRQEMLLNQYKFRCSCSACSDPKERNFLQQFDARACSSCGGAVIEDVCNLCDKADPAAPDYDQEIESVVDRILSLGHVEDAGRMAALEVCEMRLASRLFKHNTYLAKVRDMLARGYSDIGDFNKSVKYSRLSLETTIERYGTKSIEVGHELLKYTDLVLAQLNSGEAVDYERLLESLVKAEEVFSFNFGPQCC